MISEYPVTVCPPSVLFFPLDEFPVLEMGLGGREGLVLVDVVLHCLLAAVLRGENALIVRNTGQESIPRVLRTTNFAPTDYRCTACLIML